MSAAASPLAALLALTGPSASERRGGVLDSALETICAELPARLVVAFTARGSELDVACEQAPAGRAVAWRADAELAERIHHTAARVHRTGKPTWDSPLAPASDARRARATIPHLLAAPLSHRRDVLGVLLAAVDARDDASERFLEVCANVLGLALEVERSREREGGLRAELVGAGHTASLGVLLGTLAYELQGPLNAITVQAEERRVLLTRLASLAGRHSEMAHVVGEVAALANEVDLAAARLTTTAKRILALGQRDRAPDVFDLSEAASDALELCRSDFERRGVQLRHEFAPGATVRGRRDDLAQVVMNLLRNAADACERHAAKPQVALQVATELNRVVLCVEDNGPGVSRSAAEKIFESFYTTKPRGQGTGLGLKICRDVVSAHGGHIEVAANPGTGAVFRVFLPRVLSAEHRKAATLPAPRSLEQPPTRPELKRAVPRKILLVDDDEILSRALRRALRPHEVRIAPSGEEAALLLADPSYEPDAVLCDLRLPGISGDELHRRTAAKRPELARRFAFVTGGAFSEQQSKYVRESGRPTLLEPVSVHDVLALLAAISDGEEGSEAIVTLKANDG